MSPILRLLYAAIILTCAVPGCMDTHGLPKLPPYGDEWYPRPSRRVGEEGRVIVEFHLDQRGRLTANPTVTRSDASVRLEESALKLVVNLPSRIDPSNHFKPDPNRPYHVTVIFCLDPPGNCEERFFPLDDFDNTMDIVVRSTRIVITPESLPPIPHADQTLHEFRERN